LGGYSLAKHNSNAGGYGSVERVCRPRPDPDRRQRCVPSLDFLFFVIPENWLAAFRSKKLAEGFQRQKSMQ
jgi:hypothetical protein